MLFSATMPPEIEHLTSWVLNNPEIIQIGVRRSPAETVSHALYPVAREQCADSSLGSGSAPFVPAANRQSSIRSMDNRRGEPPRDLAGWICV